MSAIGDALAKSEAKEPMPEAEESAEDELGSDAIDECCAAMMPNMDPAEARSMFKAAVMQCMRK